MRPASPLTLLLQAELVGHAAAAAPGGARAGGAVRPGLRLLWAGAGAVHRAHQDRRHRHTHPPAVSALSMIGEELAVAHMDATPFFEDCAYLSEWPGLPIGDDEGDIIATHLKKKRSILLAHHGLLTAGATIEEAAVMALWLEQAADIQLRARAIGPILPILPERAKESHDFLVKPEITALTFAYFARRVLRAAPETIK